MAFVRMPDGTVAHIRCSRSPRKRCSAVGCTAWATRECDFPINAPKRKSRTCDAPICDRHRKIMGEDLDYCPPHARYTKDHEEAP